MLSTVECYNAWSNTYDSDGNILQLLDDDAFNEIVQPYLNDNYQNSTIPICCELGCGTGRNTIKILNAGWSIIALDVSTSMITKAQQRVKQFQQQQQNSSISWIIHDLNSDNELSINDSSIDAIISTLVLEHIVSLNEFFKIIYRLLKKNNHSWAFISAMHPNMYQAGSQASFIDETTGQKLCGVSFDHSIEDIIETAAKSNLILIKYMEKGIENEEHANKLGYRAKKWIGINIHASFLFKIKNN
ncbi:unnamed protein product [Adineta steineri]|uniref:Methyltransferase type 11 domain-containing protein n=1 Tax=Adineta steineri TaxID=433720 RepID=A0A818XSH4_9BILA|nr:unnamed protein product [Adineta steineri]CAF3559801.1 unnamed protein product [Adineta steineri]CAF3740719.1 unnamed protein product [Adineta steineri]